MNGKSEVDRLYEGLIGRFVEWAETRQDIRVAVVVGSRARSELPADEWADLDIVVVTSKPEYYLTQTDWISNVGGYWLTFLEPTATGNGTERRVLFVGGLDVDFAIIPLAMAENLSQNKIPQNVERQLADTFGRGVRVLVDKDGLFAEFLKKIPSAETRLLPVPTESEYLQVVNDFLYHAVWTAKHLKRGELWWAKMCSDCYMQRLLLQMIEWQACATHGWGYDTWFRGRFLEKWADPRAVEGLRSAFAHYDADDVGRALIEEVKLFRWIAEETAEKLNYRFQVDVAEHVAEWLKTCLSQRVT